MSNLENLYEQLNKELDALYYGIGNMKEAEQRIEEIQQEIQELENHEY